MFNKQTDSAKSASVRKKEGDNEEKKDKEKKERKKERRK